MALKMGKIISIAVPKGGVGKTTTAINLAVSFAKLNYKTLLIDADPSGSCSLGLGFSATSFDKDIFSVLQYSNTIKQATQKTNIPQMDFIPIRNLDYADEVRLNKISSNERLLNNILKPETYNYEFIIIDSPPYLVGITNSILIASDSVIVPIIPGKFSLEAVEKIIKHIKQIKKNHNNNIKVEGILLTIYEFNTHLSFETKKELFKKYPELIFNTSIPKDNSVGEATLKNKPVVIFDPEAKASRAYQNLAKEILQKRDMLISDAL